MATDLTTPSNTLAKMRWKEPYVSEGLNKKMNGIIPAGVIRGGRLGVSGVDMTVTIEADPDTGDSVYSFIDANGHQLTFRQIGDVALNLAAVASTTVYIGLEITYVVSAETVVKWRAFSQAEIDADSTLVVLGQVVVPASGPIASSEISPLNRRSAWVNVGREVRKWEQWIKNGTFELGQINSPTRYRATPNWEISLSPTFDDIQLVDTAPKVGNHEFEFDLNTTPGSYVVQYATPHTVFEGQLIHVSMWIRGVNVPAPTASPGGVGFGLSWYDSDVQLVSTDYYYEGTTGTFAYKEFSKIVAVPAGVSFLNFFLYADGNPAFGGNGQVYYDDINVWFESGGGVEDIVDVPYEGEALFYELSIVPRINVPSDLVDFFDRSYRFRYDSRVSNVDNLELTGRLTEQAFDLTLENGGLQVERPLRIDTDVVDQVPQLSANIGAAPTWTLMHEYNISTHTIRIYASDTTSFSGGVPPGTTGMAITANAYWDETGPPAQKWHRDSSSRNSYMLSLSNDGVSYAFREQTEADGWDWDVDDQEARIYHKGDISGAFIYQVLTLQNAFMQFERINDADNYWNPRSALTYNKNALSPRNIVNCWCLTRGDVSIVIEFYGLQPQLITGPPDELQFNFDHDYLTTSYAVFAQVSTTTGQSYYANVHSKTSTSFRVRIYDDTGAQVDCDSSSIFVSVAVIREYPTSP